MSDETRKAIDENNRQWERRMSEYTRTDLAVTLGVIAALTAFVFGWLVGAKIGM